MHCIDGFLHCRKIDVGIVCHNPPQAGPTYGVAALSVSIAGRWADSDPAQYPSRHRRC